MDDRAFAQNIIYDGVCLSDYFDITKPYIQPMPDITVSYADVPGMVGSHFGSTNYGTRRISLTLSAKGMTHNPLMVNDFIRNLLALVVKSEPKPMQLDSSFTIWAVISNVGDIERIGRRGVVTVEFVACDPFFYGAVNTVDVNEGDNTIYVSGNYPVWPVIELTGVDPSQPLIASNTDTGDKVYIPEVSDNVTVSIDMEHRRCTSNGYFLAVSPEHTDFFNLQPGYNTVRISSGRGSVSYREKRL